METSLDGNNNTDGKDTPPSLIPTKMQAGEKSLDLALEQNVHKEALLQGGSNAAKKSSSSPVTVNDDKIKVDMTVTTKNNEHEAIPGQVCPHRSNESSVEVTLPDITRDVMESKSCVDMQDTSAVVTTDVESTSCNKDLEPKKVNVQMEEKSAANEGNVSLFDNVKCKKDDMVMKEGHRASFTPDVIGRMRETAKRIFLDQATNDNKGKNDKEGPISTSQNHGLKDNERGEPVLVNKKESVVNCKSVVPGFSTTAVALGKSHSFIGGPNAEENQNIVKTTRKNCDMEDEYVDVITVTPETNRTKQLSFENNADRKSEEAQLPVFTPSSSGCNISLNPETAIDVVDTGVDGDDKKSTGKKKDSSLECENMTEGKSDRGLTNMDLLPPVPVSKPENADFCTAANARVDKSNEENVYMNNERKDDHEESRNENEIVREHEAMIIASSLFLENTEGDGNSAKDDGLCAEVDDERNEDGGESANEERGKSVNGDKHNNSSESHSGTDVIRNEETRNENATDGVSSKLTAAERIIKKFNLDIRKDMYDTIIDAKNQKSGRELPAERTANAGSDDNGKNKSQDFALESLLERKRSKLSIESIGKGRNESGVSTRRKTSVSRNSTGVHSNISSSNVRMRGVGMKGVGTEVMEENKSCNKCKEPSKNGAVARKATTMKVYVKIMCAEKGSYIKQTQQGPVEVSDKSVQIITVKERTFPRDGMQGHALVLPRDGSVSTRNITLSDKGTNENKSVSTIREKNIQRLKELVKAQEKVVKEIQSDKEKSESGTQNTNKIVDTVVIEDDDDEDEEINVVDDTDDLKIVSSSSNSVVGTASNMNIENESKVNENVATPILQPKIISTETSTTGSLDITVSSTTLVGSKQGNTCTTTQGPTLPGSSRHLTYTVADSTQVLNKDRLPQVTSTGSTMEVVVMEKLPLPPDVVNLSVLAVSAAKKVDIFPRIVGVCSLAKPGSRTEGSGNGNQHMGSLNNAEKGSNIRVDVTPKPIPEPLKLLETLSKATSQTENTQRNSLPNDEINSGKKLGVDMKNDRSAHSLGSDFNVNSQSITRKVIVSGAEYVWLPKSTIPTATITAPPTTTTNSQQKRYATDDTPLPVTTASNIVDKNSEKNTPVLLNGTKNKHLQQDNTMPVLQTSSMPLKDPSTAPPGKSMNVPVGKGIPAPAQQDSSLHQTHQMIQSNPSQKPQESQILNQQITTPPLPQLGRLPMQQATEKTGYQRVILVQDKVGKYALVAVAKDSNIPGSFVIQVNGNKQNATQSTTQDQSYQSWASPFPPQLNLLHRPPILSYNHSFLQLASNTMMPPLDSMQNTARTSIPSLGIIPCASTQMPELTRVHSPAVVRRMPQLIAVNTVAEPAHPASIGCVTPNVNPDKGQSRSLPNNFKSNTHMLGSTKTVVKVVTCMSSSININAVNTVSTTTSVISNSKSQPKLRNILAKPTSEVASNAAGSIMKTTGNQPRTGTGQSSTTSVIVDSRSQPKLRNILAKPTSEVASNTAGSIMKTTDSQHNRGAVKSLKVTSKVSGNVTTSYSQEQQLPVSRESIQSENCALSAARTTVPKEAYDTSPFWLKQASKFRVPDKSRYKLESSIFRKPSKGLIYDRFLTTGQENSEYAKKDDVSVVKQIVDKYPLKASTDFEIKLGVIENQFALVNGNRPKRSFLPNFQDQKFIQNLGLECVVEGLKGYETILKDVAYSNEKDQCKVTDYKEALQKGIMGLSMKRKLKEVMNRNIALRDAKVPKLTEAKDNAKNMQEEEQVPLDHHSEMGCPKDIDKNEKQINSNINVVEEGGAVDGNRKDFTAKKESTCLAQETKKETSHAKTDAKKEYMDVKKQSEAAKLSTKPKLNIVKNSEEESNVNRESPQKNRNELNGKRGLSIGDARRNFNAKKMKKVNGFKVRELFVGVEDILL